MIADDLDSRADWAQLLNLYTIVRRWFSVGKSAAPPPAIIYAREDSVIQRCLGNSVKHPDQNVAWVRGAVYMGSSME